MFYALSQRVKRYYPRLRRTLPLALADVLILLAAYYVTYWVRGQSSNRFLGAHGNEFFLATVALMLLSLFAYGAYDRIWTRTSGHDVQVVIRAVLLTTGIMLPFEVIPDSRPLPLSVVLVGNFLALQGFIAVRYQSRLISGFAWRWRAIWRQEFPEEPGRVLIVGAGDAGQVTAWRLKHRAPKNGHRRYHVVGYVDDDPAKLGLFVEGSRVLGTRADIPRLVREHNVELIIIAIHNISGPDFRNVLSYCERTPARIKLVPDVFAAIDQTNSTPLLRDIRPEDLLGRPCISWHAGVDAAPVTGKVILVTGAAGSIGSELCRQLRNYAPQKLIMLDNNESGLHDLLTELRGAANSDVLVPVLADITNRRALTTVFDRYHPQVIFHSAAYKHVPMLEYFPDESIRVNVGGTQQVAGLARDFGAERFVLISTDKAVNPSSIMGASKRVCELLMHALARQPGNRTLFTAVRFGNVLGSRGSVVPTFNRQIDAGGPVTVTDQAMTRYFMTIPEAVNLVIHAACLTRGDDLFMLRMGEEVPIVELAERMIRLRGLRPYQDVPIRFTGVRPGEKLHEELHDSWESSVPTAHPDIVELVSRRNGLQPVSFSDRLNHLFESGLDADRPALEQLQELITLTEQAELSAAD